MEKLKDKIQSKLESAEWKLMTKHFVIYGYLIILLLFFSDFFKKIFEKKKEAEAQEKRKVYLQSFMTKEAIERCN